MLDPNWVFVTAMFGLIGGLRYARATLRGEARPNLVTWVLWAAAPLIAFSAQLDAGVGLPAVLTLSAGVTPLIVVASAVLSRHSLTRLGPFDFVCAGIALVALGVWLGLGQAPLAVLFAVAADAVAALPTIAKAWREPYSENLFFYILIGAGAIITLLTISRWEPAAYAFAAYILTLCVLLVSVIASRRRRLGRGSPGSP